MGNSFCTDPDWENSEEARFDKQFQTVSPFCCRRVAAFPLTQMAQYEVNKSRQGLSSHSSPSSPVNSLPKRLASRMQSSRSDPSDTKIRLYPITENLQEKGQVTEELELKIQQQNLRKNHVKSRQDPQEEACQNEEDNGKGNDGQYASQNTLRSTAEDENSERAVPAMLDDDAMDCFESDLRTSIKTGLSWHRKDKWNRAREKIEKSRNTQIESE